MAKNKIIIGYLLLLILTHKKVCRMGKTIEYCFARGRTPWGENPERHKKRASF